MDDSDFMQLAMHHYKNIKCKTIHQFESDLNIIYSIKKNFKKNNNTEDYYKLLLNSIVTAYNMFEGISCTKMLFYKVRKESWSQLKTFLLYMNMMPEEIPELGIVSSDIGIDNDIANFLRKI